jgi:dienelactone hydrolase
VATLGKDVADQDVEVEVVLDSTRLGGHLAVPAGAIGVVVFAHGSGSSRHSPRNRFVADKLNESGLGTLLFDLLTPAEELDRSNVFDIATLGARLVAVTDWLRGRPDVGDLPVGYFGASTGAGAALWAAAEPDAEVASVVSRGGRPDLAGTRLSDVAAPTLLIVGGHDYKVIDLNRSAQRQLQCENRLEIVPRATHLFEEPGALEEVVSLARNWFDSHMPTKDEPRHGSDDSSVARDPSLELAREEAEGMDFQQDPAPGGSDHVAREQAEGFEVFSDPDATLPPSALREGSPGHETLTGDNLGLGADEEDERR